MSRKILSLGVLAAAFTLVLGTADAQAGHCRSDRSYRNCRQHNHCGYQQATICGHQQVANWLPTDATGELCHDEYLLRSASHLL